MKIYGLAVYVKFMILCICTWIYNVHAYRLYIYFSLLCALNIVLSGSMWAILSVHLRSCVERDVHPHEGRDPCGYQSAASSHPDGICSCPSYSMWVWCHGGTTGLPWAVSGSRLLQPGAPPGLDPWLVCAAPLHDLGSLRKLSLSSESLQTETVQDKKSGNKQNWTCWAGNTVLGIGDKYWHEI